jgi:hypothetical protein
MCQFCEPPGNRNTYLEPGLSNAKSFTFFSLAAIDEAIRQTTGGCTRICDHHRSMLEAGTLGVPQDDDEESEHDQDDDNAGDADEDYDGT